MKSSLGFKFVSLSLNVFFGPVAVEATKEIESEVQVLMLNRYTRWNFIVE